MTPAFAVISIGCTGENSGSTVCMAMCPASAAANHQPDELLHMLFTMQLHKPPPAALSEQQTTGNGPAAPAGTGPACLKCLDAATRHTWAPGLLCAVLSFDDTASRAARTAVGSPKMCTRSQPGRPFKLSSEMILMLAPVDLRISATAAPPRPMMQPMCALSTSSLACRWDWGSGFRVHGAGFGVLDASGEVSLCILPQCCTGAASLASSASSVADVQLHAGSSAWSSFQQYRGCSAINPQLPQRLVPDARQYGCSARLLCTTHGDAMPAQITPVHASHRRAQKHGLASTRAELESPSASMMQECTLKSASCAGAHSPSAVTEEDMTTARS